MRYAWILLLCSCSAGTESLQPGRSFCAVDAKSPSVVDSLLALQRIRGIRSFHRLVTPRVRDYCITGMEPVEFPIVDRTGLLAASPKDVLWWSGVSVRSGPWTLGLAPAGDRREQDDLDDEAEALRRALTAPARLSVFVEGTPADLNSFVKESLELIRDAGGGSPEWSFSAHGDEVSPERLGALGVAPGREDREFRVGDVTIRRVPDPVNPGVVVVSSSSEAWASAVARWRSAPSSRGK